MSISDCINIVIAVATIGAVYYAAMSARISARASRESARIGEESVRIGKENTKHNEAMLAQSEKQHRLSVRPHLVSMISRRTPEQPYHELDYVIENLGVGPAVIKKLEIFLDGAPFNWTEYGEIPVEVINACYLNKEMRPKLVSYGMPAVGGAIRATGSHRFFTLRYNYFVQPSKEQIIEAEDAMSRPRIRITYTSIYNDETFVWQSGPILNLETAPCV